MVTNASERVFDPDERLAVERHGLVDDGRPGVARRGIAERYFSSRTTVISSAPGESLRGLAARMTQAGSPTTSPWTHSATSRTVNVTSNPPDGACHAVTGRT